MNNVMVMKVHEDRYLFSVMTTEAKLKLLRFFGCTCPHPEIGWKTYMGPYCKICHTETEINGR